MTHKERKYLFNVMKHVKGDVVELGCWKGVGSRKFAKGLKKWHPEYKLYCVDIYSQEYYSGSPFYAGVKYVGINKDAILSDFMKNTANYPCELLTTGSLDAANCFTDNSVGFVFIDADHAEESVTLDINTWWPKLINGGIMCGHDYGKEHLPGVKIAVDRKFENIKLVDSIWSVYK